ncbi:origin recognition complex subunit 4 [Galendromus occidentalis]|uniref:Origin recognition complex subunit 4 n=1 Tax=Galendromus occidentalis TaxID=34638 RepID=A0AAJ6W083_9ACAR|nr:origin recognition complex subunit 4 [Galendromus occidentalis]
MVASSSRVDIIEYFTRKLSPLSEDASAIERLYPEVLENLRGLFLRCVLNSESNSMLVMGPRGSGKSVLVRAALKLLDKESGTRGNYSVVELDGVVHTDDRCALKDITRQLQLENVVGERVFGSFAENFQFLLDSLKSGVDRKKSKSSLFILDNFEKFTQHKSQTLLYNLFDVAQSQQAPIAVVGLCSRLDTVELLEKRVKSRFAHRFLQLSNNFDSDTYVETAGILLSMDTDRFSKKTANEWNADIAERVIPQMKNALVQLNEIDNTLRTLVDSLQQMVRRLGPDHRLEPSIFAKTVSRFTAYDPKLVVSSSIPALQMVLLVCMLRLSAIYDGEPFNFELLYKEYMRFVRSTKSSLSHPKNIVFKSFESLCNLELAQPVGGSLVSQKRYRLHHLHFCAQFVSEAARNNANLPTDVAQWISTTLSDKALGI